MVRGTCCAIVALGLLSFASVARGEPRDPVAAEALFREGRKLVEAGDFAAACPLFAESWRLDPAPGALLNLANCEEHVGQLASAWEHFRQFVDRTPASDDRYAVAKERAARLEQRVPRLAIAIAGDVPAETASQVKVFRDGIELGAPSLGVPLPVEPGEHAIVVRAPHRQDVSIAVTLGEGEEARVSVRPGAPIVQAAGPAPAAAAPARDLGSPVRPSAEGSGGASPTQERAAKRGLDQRDWALIVGATGLATLGAAGYFGVRALGRLEDSDQHCRGSTCTDPAAVAAYRDAQSLARTADVLLGVGAVSLGAAGILWFTAPKRDAVAVRPQVALGHHGVSVGMGGVF